LPKQLQDSEVHKAVKGGAYPESYFLMVCSRNAAFSKLLEADDPHSDEAAMVTLARQECSK